MKVTPPRRSAATPVVSNETDNSDTSLSPLLIGEKFFDENSKSPLSLEENLFVNDDDIVMSDASVVSSSSLSEVSDGPKEASASKNFTESYASQHIKPKSFAIDENDLVEKYQAKIRDLHLATLETTDPKEAEKNAALIKHFKEMVKDLLGVNTLKNAKQSKSKGQQKLEIKNVPLFQLVDDPIKTKSDNRASYENTEAFITAFETILKINNQDLDKNWHLYLPDAFVSSKNNEYSSWYPQYIVPLHEKANWSKIKQKMIKRFGETVTNASKIEKFVNMFQQKDEPIRAYIDRYYHAFTRLPGSNNNSIIQVVMFIKSLQYKIKDEVEKHLKENHKGKADTHYHDNLEECIEYLYDNLGDIQEALYRKANSKEVKKSNVVEKPHEGKFFNKDGKRKADVEESSYESKKYKSMTNNGNLSNPCKYCKDKEYSIDHLKTCIPYLTSNRYKKYILSMAEKEKKQKVQIYFSNMDNISNENSLLDIHSNFDDDLEDVFENIIFVQFNFDKIKYHKNFNSDLKTINEQSENPTVLFSKIDNNNIICYNVADLTEKDVQNLSPYCPLIMVNNEKLISLLDTGSQVSLINKCYDFDDTSIFENIIPTFGTFSFVDKKVISQRIGKTQPLEVKYRGRLPFNHSFEVVEMPEKNLPILIGRDLMPKLGIYVENIAYTFDEQEIIQYEDTVNHERYIPNVSKACSDEEYEEFMAIMEPYLEANRNINIHNLCPLKEAVVTLDTPPNQFANTRQYPIAYALQPVVREQIKKWAADKTIEPAVPSGFNNPLTLTPKPSDKEGNKKWRVCMDTRRINNLLPETTSVNTPLIEDIFHNVRNSKVFSVFDISGAFHRLEIAEKDRHKLTFTFDGQFWQFRGACFGLKSLSSIFQNVMETIFKDMKEYTCFYIDDLICHSEDMESHKVHCQKVIEKLTEFNLPLNVEKTHLARNSVNLLGFSLSEQGKSIDIKRLTNIDEWEKPKNAHAMMKFCGWVSYVRSHLPNASALTAPFDHLRYSTDKVLTWNPQMHEYYDSIINIIKENIVLNHPDLNHPFSLAVDASQYAIGACLFQEFVDKETGIKTIKYIGFASKSLTKSQRGYSVTRKELLALTTGLTKFYKFLYGSKPFTCYTDHRSLSYLFTTKHLSMMMMRYMEIILTFPNMNVVWIPGKENIMSDKLSRLFPTNQDKIIFEKDEKALFPTMIKQDKQRKHLKAKTRLLKKRAAKKLQKPTQTQFIKDNQSINPERIENFQQFYSSVESNNDTNKDLPPANNHVRLNKWSIKTIHDILDEQIQYTSNDEEVIEINYVQNMNESYLTPPEDERLDILKSAHAFGHYGAEAIVKRIRKDEGMNWPKIIDDAIEVVRQCSTCQKFVIAKRGYNPMKPLYCYTPGWHYQMDLCGPFPCTSSNKTYILVLLDVATRFVVLRALSDKSAKTVATELISIFSLIGYPRIINSDRGTEWKNQILDLICEAMQIDKRLSTAYYSQGNGGAERAVQNTKKLLSKLILGISEDNWDLSLNSVQLMINCKISKRLLTSPFNLMFARKMTNEYPLFNDPKDDIQPMDTDELLKRIEYMSDIVFPAIKERTEVYNKMMKNQFDKKHRLVDFPVGSFVVVRKKGTQKSLSPVYEGPYEVVRKTDKNNYTIRDELGLLMPREYTPSELKLVSQDAVVSKEDVYEFDGIVDHRGEPGNREYKIRWKNYGPEDDTWISTDMFNDPQSVTNYWKRVKGSISKEDAEILAQMSTNEQSPIPEFDKTHSGKLLTQLDSIHDENDGTLSTQTGRQHKNTSERTKHVAKGPAHKSFRRSPRGKSHSFKPAVDKTKYKKV